MKMPIGVYATLMPSRPAARRASLFAQTSGQRDAGHRGRQREGNIDDGIEQAAAGKTVTHQRPDDDHAHHQIDDRGGKGEAERNLQRIEGAAAGEDGPELIEAEFEGLEEQARKRDQDDDRQPVSVSPMVRPKPGNVLRRPAPPLTMPPDAPRPDQFL